RLSPHPASPLFPYTTLFRSFAANLYASVDLSSAHWRKRVARGCLWVLSSLAELRCERRWSGPKQATGPEHTLPRGARSLQGRQEYPAPLDSQHRHGSNNRNNLPAPGNTTPAQSWDPRPTRAGCSAPACGG